MNNNNKNRNIVYVSFKNTEKELRMYNYVNELENQEKSDFMKRALDFYLAHLNHPENK